jgi:hypothetical protein
MKTKVVILPLVAFVFALVTAFATPYFAGAKGIKPSDPTSCAGGILLPPTGHVVEDCLTTNNAVRCTVRIMDQGSPVVVDAYANGGTCSQAEALFAEFIQE